ncbi:hypothetical protein M9Y10_002509 [Tritrichomonas musculus]|uniref:Initiator binding domain-containing protein n=1 Tax=Tritrichomonas musculus TaxID=1915356 RepID=A0ABR2LB22_9EUKA
MLISSDINNCQMFSPISSSTMLLPQACPYDLSMNSNEILPRGFNLLCDDDKVDYIAIKNRFQDEINLSRHGERLDVFVSRLRIVRRFINKDLIPLNRWRRMVSCGIIFLDNCDALAINIQQLKILLGKCKSSINGSLQQLGYIAKPSTNEINQEISQQIPLIKEDYFELKKWTIRYGKFPEDDSYLRSLQRPSKSHKNDYPQVQNVNSSKVIKPKKIAQLQKKVAQFPQCTENNSFPIFNNSNMSPISYSPPQPLSCIMNAAVVTVPPIATSVLYAPPPASNVCYVPNEFRNNSLTPAEIDHSNIQKPSNFIQMALVHPQPANQINSSNPEDIMKHVNNHFPCPAKCRHKFYDILYTSASIQTEA